MSSVMWEYLNQKNKKIYTKNDHPSGSRSCITTTTSFSSFWHKFLCNSLSNNSLKYFLLQWTPDTLNEVKKKKIILFSYRSAQSTNCSCSLGLTHQKFSFYIWISFSIFFFSLMENLHTFCFTIIDGIDFTEPHNKNLVSHLFISLRLSVLSFFYLNI